MCESVVLIVHNALMAINCISFILNIKLIYSSFSDKVNSSKHEKTTIISGLLYNYFLIRIA